MKRVKKILIMAANPKATPRLRLDEEVREIEEGLRRSKYRDQFEIHSLWAIRMRDLRRGLLDYEPNIVHFIGHGKKDGLIVEGELGFAESFSARALTGLFKLCSSHVGCVILSACYSASYANAISKHIDYVIGMRKEVGDKAAIEFAVGFYDALGAGKTVAEAFEFGRNAIRESNLPGHEMPILKEGIKKDKKKLKINICNDDRPKQVHIRYLVIVVTVLVVVVTLVVIGNISRHPASNPPPHNVKASDSGTTGTHKGSGNAAITGVSPEHPGNLRIQLHDELEHKISFSIVSMGSGQYVVDRLFIHLHGYADCPLRNEVSVAAAASIPTSYAIYISKQYSQYDLPVLISPGDVGVWKYTGNSSDEFSVRFYYEPYVLFIISIEAEARSLHKNKSFLLSSDLLQLLDVGKGNAGGCFRMKDWYTADMLTAPRDAKYLEGNSILAKQLLTVDLSYSATYLKRMPLKDLENVLPELVQMERSYPDNPVFLRNRQVVTGFIQGCPWQIKIRSAKVVQELVDARSSKQNNPAILQPERPDQIFVLVSVAMMNLSSVPSFYDLRDFRLIDSRGNEQKSLGVLLTLHPPAVAPGRFFDEPFRVDPGDEATEVSETSLVFCVDEDGDRFALKYGDLKMVDFVLER